jgi:hypothetical protein
VRVMRLREGDKIAACVTLVESEGSGDEAEAVS